MAFRVVKQLFQAPSGSVNVSGSHTDPWFAKRNVYVARLSGSGDQIWEFSGSGAESDANTKATELSGSDSTDRLYKVIEI
jgi:hypothetical protein